MDAAFSRREFAAVLAGAAMALHAAPARLLGDDATADAAADAGERKFPAGRYVDVHTHLGQTWDTSEELTARGLLEWMDNSEIAQAVVLPLVSPESSSFLLTSAFVLQETQPYRDRLIPFCCVDPRTSYSGGVQGLKQMLKKFVDRGARGFGEHKPGLAIDDARSMHVYEACGELGLPVLFHLDEQRNTDLPGLPGLERVLKEFPQTIFIGHGPGWWASISGDVTKKDLGDYPSGPVAAGGAIDRLMEKYTNIHGDLSAGSGAGSISRDLGFGREFLIRRADRLMFGTDYLSPGQRVPQLSLFVQMDLPDDVATKVFRENARKLLSLEPS